MQVWVDFYVSKKSGQPQFWHLWSGTIHERNQKVEGKKLEFWMWNHFKGAPFLSWMKANSTHYVTSTLANRNKIWNKTKKKKTKTKQKKLSKGPHKMGDETQLEDGRTQRYFNSKWPIHSWYVFWLSSFNFKKYPQVFPKTRNNSIEFVWSRTKADKMIKHGSRF